jgi:hypothetical protein
MNLQELRQKFTAEMAEHDINADYAWSAVVAFLSRIALTLTNGALTYFLAEKIKGDYAIIYTSLGLYAFFTVLYDIYDYGILTEKGNGTVAAVNSVYHVLDILHPHHDKANAALAESLVSTTYTFGIDTDLSAPWAIYNSFITGDLSYYVAQKLWATAIGGTIHYLYAKELQNKLFTNIKNKLRNKFLVTKV